MQAPPPDRDARITAIFRQHARAAYRTLACCGAPAAELEDCLSQVFEIAWARVDTIQPGAERGYVCAVAARVAANARRRRARGLARFFYMDGPDLEALPATQAAEAELDPEAALARRDARRLLVRALAEMTERQREVFVLCELEELSLKEASEALGVGQAAVRSRHRKARVQFARFCERERQSSEKQSSERSEPGAPLVAVASREEGSGDEHG